MYQSGFSSGVGVCHIEIMLQEEEEIDKSQWMLPEKLMKIGDKPPLHSQYRQELCEALPYFRSYQGGHYVSKKRTLGYLLDGCPAPRDIFEDSGRVIISHGGGGSKMSQSTGSGSHRLTLVKSQKRNDFRVEALQKCQQQQLPVVLIAGKKYSGMPWIGNYDSVGYAVLGYYLVTHSWPEKEVSSDQPNKACVRFKFRFQWMSSQGDPWWLSDMQQYTLESSTQTINKADERSSTDVSDACGQEDQQDSRSESSQPAMQQLSADNSEFKISEIESNPSAPEQEIFRSSEDSYLAASSVMEIETEATSEIDDTSLDQEMLSVEDQESLEYECNTCGGKSLQLFKGSWMCLNEFCKNFFQPKISSTHVQTNAKDEELHYVAWFLRHQRSLEHEERVPFQLKPKTLQELSGMKRDFSAHQEPKVGFYCSSCGRLSIRIYWRALICSNCQVRVDLFLWSPPSPSHLPSNYRKMRDATYDDCSLYSIWQFNIQRYTVKCYILLDGAGCIIHATPNGQWLKSFADTLFASFLTTLDPLILKRNKFKINKIDGMVAQAFTLNCGEAYKFCTGKYSSYYLNVLDL
ncbi:hypothetical protein PCANC_10070 [Puccinia coronata f. sp. avenae]|uniref:YDG domain-containing protein n=1 Tax=Puccinia coronata f. sp. avenae TaxID=200324 RepID=A0A2N5UT06_9BASI|nr:hypothetical protein PCASD_10761 [Puccinia coronata f. sp. avenae]PLW43452.1 hypothetical protein PCANC_10070 [Puccinia coronata f. sp. avenae]